MKTKISILFYVKKTKASADGLVPVYLRITIEGKRVEISTKRSVEPSKWSSDAERMKDPSKESQSINKYLDMLKMQVYDCQTELMQMGMPVNAENMKNKLSGTESRKYSLMKIYQDHNNRIEALLGKEFAPATLQKYKTSLKHTEDFLKWKFKTSDIDIRAVNHAFVTEFEFYLRTVRNCANNSTVKYVKNLGKIIRVCIANGWIDKNPFANYKVKVLEVERAFLNEEEIQAIANKNFSTLRLNQIRDIFLFSCYTGLAYVDVKNLSKNQVVIGIDGERWIQVNRQKTDTRSNIPLLPMAQTIMDKYANDPQCINSGHVLPVLSNQKMNEYLKEIATLCEINKELTYHTARHTFATTVTLNNGVPIESVSKMLGHKSLKITQHYAKILDRKVSDDMKMLRDKLTPQLSVVPKSTVG